MKALSSSELLKVWEQGFAGSPIQQALLLLSICYSEASAETLYNMSIGQRDASLLALREVLFGQKLICVIDCPICKERLELSLDSREIMPKREMDLQDSFHMDIDGREIKLRLPNSSDLLAVSEYRDIALAKQIIVERCILESIPTGKLAEEVIELISEKMADLDPRADIEIELTCPFCQSRWKRIFDIVPFLWTEIDLWACHMLHDIHLLASYYGWSEVDILVMSPQRRRAYLEMIGS